MNNCYHCNKETTNPKYCSRSCAAKENNKTPKRKLTRTCLECSAPVWSYRHTRCETHFLEYKARGHKDKTIGEYRNLLSVKGKHPSWVNSHIRNFARSWLKHLRDSPCRKCGYDKHVELAHIKSVASFPDSALLSEVNSEENVIPLCPNCHWEFDNLPRYVID
jgi:hypothetical protein